MKPEGGGRAPAPALPAPVFPRAAGTIWILLALLATLRGVLAFVPGMAAWGLNVMRFLPPGVAWITWILAILPLHAAVGRRLAGALERNSPRSHTGSQPIVPWIAAGGAMLLVLMIPDRTWYVGDFLLRQGAVLNMLSEQTVFRQALPLDRVIHHDVPRWLFDHAGIDANTSARFIGLVDAGALAWIAAMLPRVLGLSGAAALATGACVFFGGHLVLFTGYGKAVVELGVLTVAVGVAGLRVLRTGGGVFTLGVALALALPLHRSAVGLLPAALFTWIAWIADPRSRETLRRPATLAGLALPWVVLAFVAPRIVRTFLQVDVPVHLAPESVRAGGVLSSAFSGLRPLDFMNIVMLLSPLAPIIPAGLAVLVRDGSRRRELVLLLLLALPGVAVMPFLHPAQGMFRDWDNFVAAGMALSLLAAWTAGEVLRSAPRWAWLGLAVAMGAAVPAVQWMLHHADSARGKARIHAFVVEPPPRTEAERALALDFLGIRHLRDREGVKAAEMFRQAVALAPSPRLHIQWALAETQAGNFLGAMQVYERLIEKTPNDVVAWRGYTAMASRLEMWPEAKHGALRLLELTPGDIEARGLLEQIERRGLAGDSLR